MLTNIKKSQRMKDAAGRNGCYIYWCRGYIYAGRQHGRRDSIARCWGGKSIDRSRRGQGRQRITTLRVPGHEGTG